MGRALLLCLALLPGCAALGAPGAPLIAIPAAVEGVSLRAFGRTTGDAIVSLVTGEDCSIARIGRGEAYCGRDDPPAPPPVCTRSLGAVDCWTIPPAAWPAHRGVADGPASLSAAQETHRIGWTGRLARAAAPAPRPEAAAAPPGAVTVIAPAPAEPVMLPALPAHGEPPAPPPRRRIRPAAAAAPPPEPGPPPVAVIEPGPPGPAAAEAARQALSPADP